MAARDRSVLILVLGLFAAPVMAQDLEARVRALEQRLSSRVLMEMIQRLDQLQHEVQTLRGQVETLQYQVEQLRQAGNAPAVADQPPAPAQPGPVAPVEEPPPAAPVQKAEPASPEAIRTAYRQAFDQLQEGHYDAAIDAFSEFLQRYPEAPLAANAYYWLGEAYYVKRDFRAASEAFRQVVDHFPASAKVADALVKLGYVAFEQGRWQEAQRHLQQVVQRFPGTRAAQLAADRLEQMRRQGKI
ncbi:MAG TPA: tol-pal system protein YbgF [Methylothermaceae bacterium]|nr:tol-pal system protein YbgF [Methylothermaceae bacterium]